MMRILVTADLHYNQPKSRALADPLINEMNAIEADALLLVGDTAGSDGDWLERCLARFKFDGPKLIIAGNHELWTSGADSYSIFSIELPARVEAMGWRWLENRPFVAGDVGIVGTVGWYDYSLALPSLGIPRRFYEAKISPGAAERLSEFADLFSPTDDIAAPAREIVARWNDGRHVKLGRSDEGFLQERLDALEKQLDSLAGCERVLVATHHLPFKELMPPWGRPQWDFARAFLGSPRMGEMISRYPNVKTVVCGHSHYPAEVMVLGIRAINVGSGYREKKYLLINL